MTGRSIEIRSPFFLEEKVIKFQYCICHSNEILKCFLTVLFMSMSNAAHVIQTPFLITKTKKQNKTLHQSSRSTGSLMRLVL